MSIWAKIGWGFLGFLVLISVGVMFLLHWTMGVFFGCFAVGVFWWVLGVLKKRVDVLSNGRIILFRPGETFLGKANTGSLDPNGADGTAGLKGILTHSLVCYTPP